MSRPRKVARPQAAEIPGRYPPSGRFAKPLKALCDAKGERTRKKHLALGQQHGVNSAAFRQHIHRTQDRVASEAAFPLLSEALVRFKMHAPGFKLAKGGTRTADPLPTTRDAMIKFVNKLQDEIEKLREKVGEARYQLTGSTGV